MTDDSGAFDWSAVAARFHRPVDGDDRPLAYFCGHSLGLAPKAARGRLDEVMRRWATEGVEGHFGPGETWYRYDDLLVPTVAELVGAAEDEVAVMGTLTANLHLLLASFFRPAQGRTAILIEANAFPSDRYAVQTHLRWHGLEPTEHLVEWPAEPDGQLDTDQLAALLASEGDRIALGLVGGVNFASGQRLDVAGVTALLHQHEILAGFDLAHAVGNVTLDLAGWGVDFASWCSYKYLNGGPGAVAGLFVADRHGTDLSVPRLGGWWGNDPDTRFAMDTERTFVPVPGAAGWRQSNPPIFALAPLAAALDEFAAVGLDRIVVRRAELVADLRQRLDCLDDVQVITPAGDHGAQLSLRATGAAGVAERLRTAGIVVDVRPPDIIRVATVPFYCGPEDIDRLVDNLAVASR